MATVNVSFVKLMNYKGTAIGRSDQNLSEAITSSGTSSASVGTATSAHDVVRIATSGNIWVNIAPSPTAAAGTEFYLSAGSVEYFAVMVGDKVAVIDAA